MAGYTCLASSIRVLCGTVILAICLLGFLRLNHGYKPIHSVSYGEPQIEAPKLESRPTKTASKALNILKPTSPLDTFDVALPASAPPPMLARPEVPLVTYVYTESDYARANLQFFVSHGLHAAADFVFILNGPTNADEMIPSDKSNIKIIKRSNTCYDLGSHREVLTARKRGGKALRDIYKRFILMNASIRGPFVPHWSKECWTEAYLGKLNDQVKLVGSSIDCRGGGDQYVQSMIWATDTIGLNIMLTPAGIGECFRTLDDAMRGAIRTTPLLKSAGYHVDVMTTIFQSQRDYEFENCTLEGDMMYEGKYSGFSVHPFEVLFIKTNRDINPVMIDNLSKWVDQSGYSSYGVCGER
ncbi:hypothetical protein ONS96_006687 [Cadophora gregata f. sp. sojae]|nr:hypothetical protein ONS96_006687 [Cadophora gregata f. sp. sojae]